MVTVLLMTLFLALVALGLWAYAHSLLTDAAGQAARYGVGVAATDVGAVTDRATEIMSHTVAGSVAGSVRCDAPAAADDALVAVHCTMTAPGIVPLLAGLLPDVEVTAHALRETP